MFASVGKHVMMRGRESPASGAQVAQPATPPPAPPESGSVPGSSYTEATEPPPCPPQLESPPPSGPRAGVALPSLGHLESGSGILVFAGTRRPERTGHTSEGEYLLWVLHLPTDPMCVASGQGRSDQA